MFNNVNAKKRLTQVIVAFMVICMTLTGSFLLLDDTINTVQAVDRTVSTKGQWDTAMQEAASQGGTWNITLGGNIELKDMTTGGKLAPVPANATVNLDMANYSITWKYGVKNDDMDTTVTAESYQSGSYANNTYWGLITNNGTLNITGTGTIGINIWQITTERTDRNTIVQKCAAIVNAGTMSLGSNISVDSYYSFAHQSNISTYASYSRVYLYNIGIYNAGGTLHTGAKISAGTLAGSSQDNDDAGFAYSFVFGIYGGKVNAIGGSVNVDAFAGGIIEECGWLPYTYGAQVAAYAVGIYSDSATLTGDMSINVLAKNWEFKQQDHNTWRDGADLLFSAGLLYVGTNYPVVGPSVDVVASFEHIGDSGTQIYIPGTGDPTTSWSGAFSDGDAGTRSHYASAVTGVSSIQNCVGAHTSEKTYSNGNFFGETLPIASAKTTEYKTLQSSFSGSDTTVSVTAVSNTSNEHTRQTSALVNGAPGNTGSGSPSGANQGIAGQYSPAASEFKKSSQYLVVYRYYTDLNNIDSVSFAHDPERVNGPAVMNVGSSADDKSGIVPDANTPIVYAGGATSKNEKYYQFMKANYELIESADSGLDNRLNDIVAGNAQTPALWAGTKTPVQDSGLKVTNDKDYVAIIYLDYKILPATAINIYATNGDANINNTTTSRAFTVPYTGEMLKPGTNSERGDFNLGILDDKKVNITGDYNISGADTVTYKYAVGDVRSNPTASNIEWFDDLPKDVGTYTIEVKVLADNTYKATGSYNRLGKTQLILGTITPANVTLSGSPMISGDYGVSYRELFNEFKDFVATNKAGQDVKNLGSWSIEGVSDLSKIPDAGTYNINVVWTPGAENSKNYGVSKIPVTLVVNKKEVTVSVGTATAIYGESTFNKIELTYDGLPTIDNDKKAEWLKNTTFTVIDNGIDSDFKAGKQVGQYGLSISYFGGMANNVNYIFKFVDGTLDIQQRAVIYQAEATPREYNGSKEVEVTLSNPTNAYGNDTFAATISTTGSMENEDAGKEKKVVNIADVTIQNAHNYYLVIENAASLTVEIAQARPSGVSVTANPSKVTYDDAQKLSAIKFDETKNPDIPGKWAWEDSSIVPTVNQKTYVAVFTPDSKNYSTLKQDVALTVEQAEVIVTVDDISVTYGDKAPALNGAIKYITVENEKILNINDIPHEGKTDVSTDYTAGSDVYDEGYTIFVETNISSENYKFTAQEGKITVDPMEVTVTAKDYSITYGDSAPKFEVTTTPLYNGASLSSIGVTANVTTSYLPGNNVGNYILNVSVTKNNNYAFSYKNGTLTVEPAVLTVTPVEESVEYGSAVPMFKYNIDGFVNNDNLDSVKINGTPKFIPQYNEKSPVSSHPYPVDVDVSEMSSTNYTFKGVTGSIFVEKAGLAITTAPAATVVNTHSLAEAKFDNTAEVVNRNNTSISVPGTFTFDNGTIIPEWNTTVAYSATFTPDDTDNYTTTTVNISVSVVMKEISGIPVIQGSAMENSILTASLASMNPATAEAYTFQWYSVENDIATPINDATGAEYKVEKEDVGKTIYVVLTANEANGFTGEPVESAKTATVIVELNPTTKEHFNVVLPSGIVYDATSHAATVTIKDGLDSKYFGNTITVKYNGSEEAPVNAGTYVVTVDINAPEKPAEGYNGNYHGPATGIQVGEFTIERAPLEVTVVVKDKPYDGTVSAEVERIDVSGVVSGDDVDIVKENVRASFSDFNAGNDIAVNVTTVPLDGTKAANYVVVVKPTTASISPATLYVTATGVRRTYNKTATVSVIASNIEGYAPRDSANTIYLINGTATATSANAGVEIPVAIGSIQFERAGSSKDNYVIEIVNDGAVKVTIDQAKPDVTPLVIGEAFVYDSQRPLSSINPNNYYSGNGSWEFVGDTSIVPTVNQKTYAAIYTPNDKNYYPVTSEITINIVPKAVTITAVNLSVPYGSTVPAYKTTEDGFTGSDSLANMSGSIKVHCDYYQGVDAGSYLITIEKGTLDNDNYTFSFVPGVLTVSPRIINVTATAVDKEYDGNKNIKVNFTVDSGIYGNDNVILSYSSVTGTAATANAGTTTVDYVAPTIVGEKHKRNYSLNITPDGDDLTVVISKVDVKGVVFPQNAVVEYGFDLSYATFEKTGTGNGTFAFENAKITVPGDIGEYKNKYKVIFTPADSINYNSQEAYVTVTVVPCTLNYVVGIAGTLQSGQTLSVVTTGLPAKANDFICYQWYRFDGKEYSAINGATGKTYVATDADVGYALVVMTSFVDNAPYVFEDGVVDSVNGIDGIISEATDAVKEITLTFWQRLMNWLYRIIAILTGIQLGGGLGIGG